MRRKYYSDMDIYQFVYTNDNNMYGYLHSRPCSTSSINMCNQ